MQRRIGVGFCVAALSLNACADMNGPPHTIGARGPVGKSSRWRAGSTLNAAELKDARAADKITARQPAGMAERFYVAEKAAYEADQLLATDGRYAVVPDPIAATVAKANKAAHARYEIDSAIAKANYDALVAAEPGLKGTPHQPLVQRAFTPEPIPTPVQYNSQAQDRMLDTGFTLTYSYCSHFF